MTAAKPDIYAPDDSGTAISETERAWLRADREAAELAGLCSRAADRLEDLAGVATPGGWHLQPDDLIGGWCVTIEDRPPSTGARQLADFVREEDAAWIAALHPGVAPPLVTWLRDVADLIAKVAPSWVASGRPLAGPEGFGGVPVRAAVGFARVVLGQGSDGSPEPRRASVAASDGAGVPQGGSGGSEPSTASPDDTGAQERPLTAPAAAEPHALGVQGGSEGSQGLTGAPSDSIVDQVYEAAGRLDGSTRSAVRLLTGFDDAKLDRLGGFGEKAR